MLADYNNVHFFKTWFKYVVFTFGSKSNKNQSIKSIRINIPVWTKKNWGQTLFKRPNLRPGQIFEARPEIFLRPTLGPKLRPTLGPKLRPGQLWGQTRFYSMPFLACCICEATFVICTKNEKKNSIKRGDIKWYNLCLCKL